MVFEVETPYYVLGYVPTNAVRDGNVRVVQFGPGAVVIPHAPDFMPLEVFGNRYFTGPSKRLASFAPYGDAGLGERAGAIGSFQLKRGYMATFAQQENGVAAHLPGATTVAAAHAPRM